MAKGKGKPKLVVVPTVGPTEAQSKRHEYAEAVLQEGTLLKGRTVRRIPVYVTMHKQKRIPDELMQAFGWYRDRWDTSLHSPLRDSLGKHQPRTGGGSYERFRARVIDALADVEYAEAGVPPFLRQTLRSVVLDDLTATEIARARWGKFEPGQERIDRVVAELVLAGLKLTQQVSHIVQNPLAYPSRKR